MKKTNSILFVAIAATLLSGCSKSPPKCSDEETLSLIREILVEKMGGKEGVTDKELEENMKFSFPRASAFDEKIKKYTCEAKLEAGGTVTLPITYESQLDDSDQHIVSIGGIAQGDFYIVKHAIAQGIQTNRAGKAESTPPAENQINKPATTPPPTPKKMSADECVSQLVDNFRKENGEDLAISHDQIEEWRVGCEEEAQ